MLGLTDVRKGTSGVLVGIVDSSGNYPDISVAYDCCSINCYPFYYN